MLNYAGYRSNIKSGDLLAWSHRGWRSWYDIKIQLIRLFMQSEYSHTGTAWVIAGRVLVIEAVEPAVRIFPLSKLGSFYHIELKAPWLPSTEEAALDHVGKEYKQLHALQAYFKELEQGDVSECAALTLDIAMRDGIFLGKRALPSAVVREAQRLGNPTFYIEN